MISLGNILHSGHEEVTSLAHSMDAHSFLNKVFFSTKHYRLEGLYFYYNIARLQWIIAYTINAVK